MEFDLSAMVQARLDEELLASAAAADSQEEMLKPQRTQSHFVEMNSKNEELLMVGITPENEESLNALLLEEDNGEVIKHDDDDLLV